MNKDNDWKSLEELEKEGKELLENWATSWLMAKDKMERIQENYLKRCSKIKQERKDTPKIVGIILVLAILFIITSIKLIGDGLIIAGMFCFLVSCWGGIVIVNGMFFLEKSELKDAHKERDSATKTHKEKIEEIEHTLPVDMDKLLESYRKTMGRQEKHNQELTRLACRVIGTRHDLTELQEAGKISALNQFKETIDAAIQRTLMRFIGVNEISGRLVMYDDRVKQPNTAVPSSLRKQQRWHKEDAAECSKWEEEMDLAASSLNEVRIQLVRYEQSEEDAKMRILNAGLLPAWQELQVICEALDEIIDLSDPERKFDRELQDDENDEENDNIKEKHKAP